MKTFGANSSYNFDEQDTYRREPEPSFWRGLGSISTTVLLTGAVAYLLSQVLYFILH